MTAEQMVQYAYEEGFSAAAVVVWEAQGALHRWDGGDIHWRQNNDIVCTNGLIDRELKPILIQQQGA